jgi:hypothetical protein
MAEYVFLAQRIMGTEVFKLFTENWMYPLMYPLIFKFDTVEVTHRVRTDVLESDARYSAREALRIKESYRDTFAMEAVAVGHIQVTFKSQKLGCNDADFMSGQGCNRRANCGDFARSVRLRVNTLDGHSSRLRQSRQWTTSDVFLFLGSTNAEQFAHLGGCKKLAHSSKMEWHVYDWVKAVQAECY